MDPLGLRSVRQNVQQRMHGRAMGAGLQTYSYTTRNAKAFSAYISRIQQRNKLTQEVIEDIDGHIKKYFDFDQWMQKRNLGDIEFEYGLTLDDLINENRYSCSVKEPNIQYWACYSEPKRSCSVSENLAGAYGECVAPKNFLFIGRNEPSFLEGDGYRYNCKPASI